MTWYHHITMYMMIGYIVYQFTVPHCSFIMIRYRNLTGTKIHQQANSSTVTSSLSVKFTEVSENIHVFQFICLVQF